jgi:hypothetical protein
MNNVFSNLTTLLQVVTTLTELRSFLIVVAYLSLQTAVERNNKRHEICQTRMHEKKKSCPGWGSNSRPWDRSCDLIMRLTRFFFFLSFMRKMRSIFDRHFLQNNTIVQETNNVILFNLWYVLIIHEMLNLWYNVYFSIISDERF